LFLLEELRDRKFDGYARVIQKCFRKYNARKKYQQIKEEACQVLLDRKQRKRNSLNRNFVGDYIGLDHRPELRQFAAKRERIEFADTVVKYDRRFKSSKRDLLLSPKYLYLIGREVVKKGPEKGTLKEVLKRKIDLKSIESISLSTLQDDIFVIHVRDEYDSVLESMFKTEFLHLLSKKIEAFNSNKLSINFNNKLTFKVKKEGWGGGGSRQINFFCSGQGNVPILKASGKTLNVTVGQGLPENSRPEIRNMRPARSAPKHMNHTRRAPPPSNRPNVPYPSNHVTKSSAPSVNSSYTNSGRGKFDD